MCTIRRNAEAGYPLTTPLNGWAEGNILLVKMTERTRTVRLAAVVNLLAVTKLQLFIAKLVVDIRTPPRTVFKTLPYTGELQALPGY